MLANACVRRFIALSYSCKLVVTTIIVCISERELKTPLARRDSSILSNWNLELGLHKNICSDIRGVSAHAIISKSQVLGEIALREDP